MKRSLFSKLFEVVEIFRINAPTGKSQLVDLVGEYGLEIFQGWFYNEDQDELEQRQSTASIRNAVNLACDLGLVRFTHNERGGHVLGNYTSLEDFAPLVGVRVLARLKEYGVGVKDLNQVVDIALSRKLRVFPTATYLHGEVGSSISKARFVRYLSLLQAVGIASVSSRKLYIGFSGPKG